MSCIYEGEKIYNFRIGAHKTFYSLHNPDSECLYSPVEVRVQKKFEKYFNISNNRIIFQNFVYTAENLHEK